MKKEREDEEGKDMMNFLWLGQVSKQGKRQGSLKQETRQHLTGKGGLS